MAILRDRLAAEVRAHLHDFSDVRATVLFVGYPRSGHSFIGAALNAHPDCVMAHELDLLKFVDAGFDREQLFATILDRDQWWRKQDWQWMGWSYRINDWQGRYRKLRVMGDKSGGLVSRQLLADPSRLNRLRKRVGAVRLIHHVRNPFDTIATMHRKGQPGIETLADAVVRYRDHCEGVRLVFDDALTIRHEDFVADPRTAMSDICAFVGLAPDAEYLDACAGHVHESPRRSRDLIEWTPDATAGVERIIADYPWFAPYH